jgi:hypothetical protein
MEVRLFLGTQPEAGQLGIDKIRKPYQRMYLDRTGDVRAFGLAPIPKYLSIQSVCHKGNQFIFVPIDELDQAPLRESIGRPIGRLALGTK